MVRILFAVILFIFLSYLSNRMKLEPLNTSTCKKNTDCSQYTYCDKNICVNKLDLGNTCVESIQCKYGGCDKATNKCKLIKSGESCSVNNDCESGICDGSLHCK
jgi:hypothetical protein